MHIIILAGGKGVRLWPISNQSKPKALIRLGGEHSLLQQTIMRVNNIQNVQSITIVTNRLYRDQMQEAAKQVSCIYPLKFVIEEEHGDTTIAIAAAALNIARENRSGDNLLILPCDHVIKNDYVFHSTIKELCQNDFNDKITLLGIKPQNADTNYGYVEHTSTKRPIFIEKPNHDLASRLVDSGRYLWNSGMIYASGHTLLREIKEYNPGLVEQIQSALNQNIVKDGINYCELRKIEMQKSYSSMDYSTLQKSNNLRVIPCDIDWVDIGNWHALSKLLPSDSLGNNIRGQVVTYDTVNCHVEAHNKKIVTIGVEDLTIIEAGENILILNKSQVSNLKNIYDKIGISIK